MSRTNTLTCTNCGITHPLSTRDWRCGCGGLFDLEVWPALDPSRLNTDRCDLWRYRAFLPLNIAWEPVALGEGNTPLLPISWEGRAVHLKLESLSPTGSFKDRGAAVLVTALRGLGIERVVEDSSGNAGAALAAYTARAGIACEVCVPFGASGPKLAQIAAHGAEVIEIKGRREYAALAAWAAAAHGAYYASHVYNPFFLAGIQTFAFEIWEQLDHNAPDALVIPVGNGTLLLGVYDGFRRLQEAGLVDQIPRLFAVQSAACAPLYEAFAQGLSAVEPISPEPTIASGIAIGQPVRAAEILDAVRASKGVVFRVTEDEIETAHNQLASSGFYVEETSAVAVAALGQLRDSSAAEGTLVVPLTGHGLKKKVGG